MSSESEPATVDYARLGLTPEEEALMIRLWNVGLTGAAGGVWRVVRTNTAITGLLVYGVWSGSWAATGVALLWIGYNTVVGALWVRRDAPLWHSALTKIEARLAALPSDDTETLDR